MNLKPNSLNAAMKKATVLAVFIASLFAANAQAPATDTKLNNLIKLDLSLGGVGFTYEPRLGKKTTIDLSAGIGGGYDVSESSFGYEWNILEPAFYFSANPKFYYNRQKRYNKGKNVQLNSGNYFGLRVKYATAGLAQDGGTRQSLLINLHWGIQRAIGRRWTMNTHVGLGYAEDLDYQFGTIYPALDLKFSYVLWKGQR
jgi:hypothetical protein